MLTGLPRSLASRVRLGFLLAPAGVFFLSSCGSGNSPERAADRLVPSVEAVQARSGALPLTQRLSGLVRAYNQVEIVPQISAVIMEVLVENGAEVKAGQPVVRLRDTEFRERLKQANASHQIALAELRRAEARLREARAELDRARSLKEKDLVSRSGLETIEARAEAADAEVQLAKARVEQALASAEEQQENLSQTVIRAPISGHVGNREAEVGMLASPNRRLFTLGQLDSVRVEVVLTDRMLESIKKGQRSEVSTAGAMFSAPLARISPFLNPVSHSTEAEIDLANPDGLLRPGMFVTVDVFYGESEEATLVPLSALYENPATGAVGVFATRDSLEGQEPVDVPGDAPSPFTVPVTFEFVPTEIVAQGRMEAGVRGVAPETWVVTLGQNLLGAERAEARVRPVRWSRVERLQRLQREDLMRDLVERQSSR